MYLPHGTELNNRYVIESLLGHGGFGITYAAYDKVLNVRVAVKEYLPRQLATRAEGQTKVSVFTGEARQQYIYGLRKFLEEAQSMARFAHHPNVVSARDYFEANGTAYMVMEYVEGVTLKEYLANKGGRISFEEAKGIMMPVMDALREVHQAGMLHRDISPDNIYLTTSAQVKILDFGAARYFTGEQSKSLSVILKSGYAPEEQYRSSGKQGAWTDIYAVGATIYKVLTGQTPPDALDRMAGDALTPPSRLGVNIPANAERALLQALEVHAGERFQTMGAFQQALMGVESMSTVRKTRETSIHPESKSKTRHVPESPPAQAEAQPSPQPTLPPPSYPQGPRRLANPVAIAAGVIGLILLVALFVKVILPPILSTILTAHQEYAERQARERRAEEEKEATEKARLKEKRRKEAERKETQRLAEEEHKPQEAAKRERERRSAEQHQKEEQRRIDEAKRQQEEQRKAQERAKQQQEAQRAEPLALMPMNAFTPIVQGYDFIRQGEYETARNLFVLAVQRDRNNPFALNNLAVLKERQGKLNDALGTLKTASINADKYLDKVTQTCFAGGGSLAVKPMRDKGDRSSIAAIIRENIKKLETKADQLKAAQRPAEQRRPAQNNRVIINSLKLNPPFFQTGQTVTVECGYTVLSETSQKIPVEVKVSLIFVNKLVMPPVLKNMLLNSGSYVFHFPVIIPQNALKGNYTILAEVKAADNMAKKICDFWIR
jgi:serine/threonine protein kinase/tetratricopeptide (TPR) repeat protein